MCYVCTDRHKNYSKASLQEKEIDNNTSVKMLLNLSKKNVKKGTLLIQGFKEVILKLSF